MANLGPDTRALVSGQPVSMSSTVEIVDPPLFTSLPYPRSHQEYRQPDAHGRGGGRFTFEGPGLGSYDVVPGQWILTKAARTFGWQKQTAAYQNGATVVPTGDPPMDIEYEVRIWEAGTYFAFIELCQTLLKKCAIPVQGKADESAALGINDPILKVYGVVRVVTAFVDMPKNPLITSGGKGAWIGKVGFIEFRKGTTASPPPQQDYPETAPLGSGASSNLATAQAAVAQGAANRQAAAAQRLLPPK